MKYFRLLFCVCTSVGGSVLTGLLLWFLVFKKPTVWLDRVPLTDDPLALCNDGTPGSFYYYKGADDAPWFVHLEGGHWCWDEQSCKERSFYDNILTSSRQWVEGFEIGGLYAARSGPLADAHVVWIGYCTSDAHLGDIGAEDVSFGWHFRGQQVVIATLRALVRRGLGSRGKRDRLLFTGCSAGGRGAMSTLDFVQQILAGEGADVEVLGVLDAPLWLDRQPYRDHVVSLPAQTRMIFDLVNASGRVTENCREAFPGEEWKCLFAEYRLQHVQTPFVLNVHQYDDWQLLWNMGSGTSLWPEQWTSEEKEYASAWRAYAHDFLTTSHVPHGSLYFASACFVHCTTDWDDAYVVTVPTPEASPFDGERATIKEVVTEWFAGWRPEGGRLVDSCGLSGGFGVDCGCEGKYVDKAE
eukprot:TRINITY_DN47167_c0_g1_i1.p1 TRINITY_DN47167_c0_g1~~TRINITY_DN47167_c0_g1_i1.p1  ORF type:complete len:412 (+),score=30.80 TRINITY_DN47167_c0_g1_i1:207-1442(+)